MVATHKSQEKWKEGCFSHPIPDPSSGHRQNNENVTNTDIISTLQKVTQNPKI
jgi:hypothetical protein